MAITNFRRAGKEARANDDHTVTSLQYPLELGDPGHNHYVIFYINIPGHSKVNAEVSSIAPQQIDSVTNSVANVISGITGSSTNTVSFSENINISIAPSYKQLKSAIALYMPNNWVESYNANYEKASYNNIVNIVADSANKANGSLGEFTKSVSAGLSTKMLQGVTNSLLDAVGGEGFGAGLSKKISNPNTEQLFTGMEHRSFSFDFLLAPKSEKEANNVARIIEMFRYHMHPETSTGRYLIFPAEFEIEFYSDGDVNTFVGSVSTCVLSGMDVDYTPNRAWSAFKNTGGYATSVNMSLRFTEVEPLTKQRLEQFKESPYTNIADNQPVYNNIGLAGVDE